MMEGIIYDLGDQDCYCSQHLFGLFSGVGRTRRHLRYQVVQRQSKEGLYLFSGQQLLVSSKKHRTGNGKILLKLSRSELK